MPIQILTNRKTVLRHAARKKNSSAQQEPQEQNNFIHCWNENNYFGSLVLVEHVAAFTPQLVKIVQFKLFYRKKKFVCKFCKWCLLLLAGGGGKEQWHINDIIVFIIHYGNPSLRVQPIPNATSIYIELKKLCTPFTASILLYALGSHCTWFILV